MTESLTIVFCLLKLIVQWSICEQPFCHICFASTYAHLRFQSLLLDGESLELFNISKLSVFYYLQLISNNDELRAILLGFSKEGFVGLVFAPLSPFDQCLMLRKVKKSPEPYFSAFISSLWRHGAGRSVSIVSSVSGGHINSTIRQNN